MCRMLLVEVRDVRRDELQTRPYTSHPESVQRDEVPLPRVWGCPPTSIFPSPKNGESRGLKTRLETGKRKQGDARR